jgi:hypothetical protein
MVKQGRHARGGLHILERDSLQPSGGPVNHGKQILVALWRRRKRANQVDVQMGEPLGRYRNG